MRFAASPLLVAVALGLLGPAALDPEDEDCEQLNAPPIERAADALPVELEAKAPEARRA
jgi:hypothetical protein